MLPVDRMPARRPPIDAAAWDAHKTAQIAQHEATATASFDAAEQAQRAADQAAEADFSQRAQAQFDAAVAPAEAAQRSTSFLASAQQRFEDLLASVPRLGAAPGAAPAGPPAPAMPQGPPAGDGTGGGLGRVYGDALAAGLDEEGARVAMAVAQTEGGMTGAVGDLDHNPLGAAGTFQLNFGGGQGNNYARARGISDAQARDELSRDPHVANRWALQGYLGQAIRRGQAMGLRGAELATFAQHTGQVSVTPERAGANYAALQGQAFDQTSPGSVAGRQAQESAEERSFSAADAQAPPGSAAPPAAWGALGQMGQLGGVGGVPGVAGSSLESALVGDTGGERPPSEFEPPSQFPASPFERRVPEVSGPVTVAGVTVPRQPLAEGTPPVEPWRPPRQVTPEDIGVPVVRPTAEGAPEPPPYSAFEPAQQPTPPDVGPVGRALGAVEPVLAGLGKIGAPGRAGFPTPGQPSGESPGQRIARLAQQSMQERPDWNIFQHLGAALDRSGEGFERTLALGPQYDPLTGGVVAGAAGTVARLATDPLTTVGGALPGTMRVGMVGGGAAGAGYGLATGASPAEVAADVETGATLGSLGVPTALGAGRLAARGARVAAPHVAEAGALAQRAGIVPGLSLEVVGGAAGGAVPVPRPRRVLPRLTEQPPLPVPPPGGSAPNLYDRLSVARMAGMVSGTAGQLFNTTSNVVGATLDLGLKPAQVALDAALSATTGKPRERFLAEWGPQLRSYGAGALAGLRSVPRILLEGVDADTLAKLESRRFASGSKAADLAVELPLRLLGASDAVFRGGSFAGHAAALATRQAIREGLTGPARAARAQEILEDFSAHPGLVDEANALAARAVGQEQRGELAPLMRLRGTPVGRVFSDVFVPFLRTPYNFAAQGAGMTPAGYGAALAAAGRHYLLGTARRKLAAGAPPSALSRLERAALAIPPHPQSLTGEAIDRAVRATVGTGVVYLGLNLAANNMLTGAYPEDETERSTLPEGWKPYSLRLPTPDGGTVYVPVAALGTLAVGLGVAANAAEANKRGAQSGDVRAALVRGITATSKYMLDVSALQGLNALSKLVTEPERNAEAVLESFAASLVPHSGFARQVQQALGDSARDPRGPLEAFVAQIPGLSGLVPEKLTPLGEARSRGPSGPLALAIGSRIGVERDEPTLRVLREARVGLPAPSDTALGLPLTEAEQRRVQVRAGEIMRETMAWLQDDAEFRSLSPRRKGEIVETMRDNARRTAGTEVLDALPDEEIARRAARAEGAKEQRRPLAPLR